MNNLSSQKNEQLGVNVSRESSCVVVSKNETYVVSLRGR